MTDTARLPLFLSSSVSLLSSVVLPLLPFFFFFKCYTALPHLPTPQTRPHLRHLVTVQCKDVSFTTKVEKHPHRHLPPPPSRCEH